MLRFTLIALTVIILVSCSAARYEANVAISESHLMQLGKVCSDFERDHNRFPKSLGEIIDYDDSIISILICPASGRPYEYHGEDLKYVKLNLEIELVRSPYLKLPLNAAKVPLFSVDLKDTESLTFYADFTFGENLEFN